MLTSLTSRVCFISRSTRNTADNAICLYTVLSPQNLGENDQPPPLLLSLFFMYVLPTLPPTNILNEHSTLDAHFEQTSPSESPRWVKTSVAESDRTSPSISTIPATWDCHKIYNHEDLAATPPPPPSSGRPASYNAVYDLNEKCRES